MTLISLRRTAMARAGLLLILSGVAGCATPDTAPVAAGRPPQASVAAPTGPVSAASPGAQQNTASLDSNGKPLLFNDPPAPPDTPLCGRQAREINGIGTTLQGSRVATSGICSSFACYDPLTATYIGADGYRHVCR